MANTSKRGFASMDAAKQREIASKGGKAAHAKGTAHEFTSDEARVAGRKGGEAVSRDRAHMSAIGREVGHSRGARARAAQSPDNGGQNAGAIGNNSNANASSSNRSGSSSQQFDRQVSSDRGNFDAGNRSGAQQQRSAAYTASDRGNTGSRGERSNDRSSDTQNEGPFAGRDEI